MPLRKGKSHEVISGNIKEMVKAGHKPKQAIAAALAHARKYSEGGMVDDSEEMGMGSIDSESDEGMAGEPVYPVGMDDQGLSENVMKAQKLAEGLQAHRYAANDNTNDYEADDMVSGQKMSKGGMVQGEADAMVGNKPELDWINDGTGEPMSSMPMKPDGLEHSKEIGAGPGLSAEALEAIKKKKMARIYGSYDPK